VVRFEAVEGDPEVEFDPYTPVTITWPGYHASLDAPSSVMIGTGGNYVELKYDASNGALVEVVLVSAATVTRSETSLGFDDDADPVVPVIEVGPDKRTVDETPVRVTAYRDALEIRWADSPAPLAGAGMVHFGQTDDGALSAIALSWDDRQREEFIKLFPPHD